jgi:uncharacterized protein YdbL (DUF1318 family)
MKSFVVLLLPLVALAIPAVSWAGAAELEWHQDRVAALARDLIEPLEALGADLESRPSGPDNVAARTAVINDVERLRLRAGELAERLARGAGRAETVALFREVVTLQNQAVTHTREYPAPFDMHVYTDRVQRITVQLARYYGESSGSDGGSAIPLDAAMRAGHLGEQADGYVGVVPGAPPSARALADRINGERAARYDEIAAKTATSPAAIAALAGERRISRAAPGEWIRDATGKWQQR